MVHQTKQNTIPFLKKLNDHVAKCWQSVGSIACTVNEVENQYTIAFFPVVVELVGGARDGEVYFNGFHFNISKFVKIFDKPGAKVGLDCLDKALTEHIIFTGKIDGHSVKVAILVAPPDGHHHPLENLYMTGPKAGKNEVRNDKS